MVRGITNFKKRFQGYEEQYVIIGGTACDLIMENEELPFRATKDIDLVLIVEALTAEFGETFWKFIKEAEYDHCNKSTGEAQLKDDRWNLCVECGMSDTVQGKSVAGSHRTQSERRKSGQQKY